MQTIGSPTVRRSRRASSPVSSAFTLIELLVVIAIIAILAAILFPVFAQAREKARQTACLSNEKQISNSLLMYIQDYDEELPPVNSGGTRNCWGCGHPDKVWPELVQPYAKNWAIFTCPSEINTEAHFWDPNTDAPLPATDDNYYYAQGVRASYGMNFHYLSPWFYGTDPATKTAYYGALGTTINQIKSPADTIMITESLWDKDASGNPKGGGNWVVEAPCINDETGVEMRPQKPWGSFWGYNTPWDDAKKDWLYAGGAYSWHKNNLYNTVFVDGHVKPISRDLMLAGCNKDTRNRTDKSKYIWDLD